MTAGTLYVVATPIGNLDDLSQRATTVLRSVGVVAAEDTRRTRKLLTHLDAKPRLMSYHAHSDSRRADQILEELRRGVDVALVTDAGTPSVSDPGGALVRAARDEDLPVAVIPGASAVSAALSLAGVSADRYAFLGFLPRKGRERGELLEAMRDSRWTTVVFEAPGRLVGLLADLAEYCGPEREVAVARELTKVHEELKLGTISNVQDYYELHPPKGEVTVIVTAGDRPPPSVDADRIVAAARPLLKEGRTRRDVAKRLAAELGVARNEVYRIVSNL